MILVRQSRPLSYTPPSDLPFSLLLYHNFLIRQKWYHSSSSVMQCQALPIIDGWVYIIMEHLLQPLQYSGFQHWYLICTGYKGLESNPWRWRNHSWGNAINAWYLSWYLLASSPDQAAWQWAGNEVRCTITMTTIFDRQDCADRMIRGIPLGKMWYFVDWSTFVITRLYPMMPNFFDACIRVFVRKISHHYKEL